MTGTPRWTERNGISLRYDLREGEDDCLLVLVHEMGGSLESWDLVLPLIDRHRAVLRYDMRGAGLSAKVRDPLTIADLSGDVGILLETIAWRGPVALAGIAVGGAVAMHFAARTAHRTAALMPFGPATGVGGDRRRSTLERAEAVERGGMASIAEAALAMSYPEVLRGRDPARFAALRARWLSNDPGSYAAILRMLASLDMGAELAAIACPTLVLAGTEDLVRPPEAVRQTAAMMPGARFETLPTGHFAAVQAPELLAERLNRFLSEIDGQPGTRS